MLRDLLLKLKQTLNHDVILTIGTRLIILCFAFASTIITARFLGPAGRGSYFYIVTIANLLAQFCNLGLPSSNTFFVAKDINKLPKLVINSMWIAVVWTGAVSLMIVGAVHLFSYDHNVTLSELLVSVILAPAILYNLLAGNLLIGIHRIASFNMFQLMANVCIALILIVVGFVSPHPFNMLIALTVVWVGTGCLMTFSLIKSCNHKIWQPFQWRVFKEGLGFSLKAYVAMFLGNFILRIGVFFVKHVLTLKAVGYFSIAAQLNDTLAILPTSIAMVLFPRLVRQAHNRWQQTKSNLVMTAGLMLGICVIALMFTRPFIEIAFGKHYLPSVEIFYYMLPGAFFYALISIISQYLSAIGFPLSQVFMWLLAFAMICVGNYVLVPIYGAIGASIALSLTFFILFIGLFNIAVHKGRTLG